MGFKYDGTCIFFSFSLICVAMSIIYCSYSLVNVVEELPQATQGIVETAKIIDSMLDKVQVINDLAPEIIDELAHIRQHIPPVLEEVTAVRKQLPSIVAQIDKVQSHIPSILNEAALVREQTSSVVTQLEAYRVLVPDILNTVDATREMVPPSLDRVQILIQQASDAGKEASEGAVSGVITGVVKLPITMLSSIGDKIFGGGNLDKNNRELMTKAAFGVINSAVIGKSENWRNKKSGAMGTVTLQGLFINAGRQCRTLAIYVKTPHRKGEYSNVDICLNDNAQWEVIKRER